MNFFYLLSSTRAFAWFCRWIKSTFGDLSVCLWICIIRSVCWCVHCYSGGLNSNTSLNRRCPILNLIITVISRNYAVAHFSFRYSYGKCVAKRERIATHTQIASMPSTKCITLNVRMLLLHSTQLNETQRHHSFIVFHFVYLSVIQLNL